MKVTMRLTLDGLIRAMRVKAHQLGDRVESGIRQEDDATSRGQALRDVQVARQEDRHDGRRA